MQIRNNDTIMVIKGRDRGKQGKVQKVFPKYNKVLVEGVNVVMRHTKSSGRVQAGIIQKELPIRVSNVILMCSNCNQPSRSGTVVLASGNRARVCKKCQEVIE